MLIKRCLPLLSLVVFLGFMPRGAWAYSTDVHFSLTYVLCRLAGLEAKDALWVAAADESMDRNNCTTAYSDADFILPINTIANDVWERNGEFWHAFTSKGALSVATSRTVHVRYQDPGAARKAVEERMDFLWQIVLHNTPHASNTDRDKSIKADIAMGQFLHFEQDYFAHRQLKGYLDNNTWLPYEPTFGHFVDGHTPDYVYARPDLAKLMVQDSYSHINAYTLALYGKSKGDEVSQELLFELVNAISKSYHVKPLGGLLPFDITPPTQIEVSQALSKVVGTDWGKVEIYTDQYILPYDNPKTSLAVVKQKLGEDQP